MRMGAGTRQPLWPRLKSGSRRGLPELTVERRQDHVLANRVLPREGSRQLDGIVPAQSVIPRQRVRPRDERFADGHSRKVRPLS